MTRESFLQMKQYQLELILLGVALARSGDRQHVSKFAESHKDSFIGEQIPEVIKAMAEKDRDLVRLFFRKKIRVDPRDGEPLVDCLTRTIAERSAERLALKSMKIALLSDNNETADSLRARLLLALDGLDTNT